MSQRRVNSVVNNTFLAEKPTTRRSYVDQSITEGIGTAALLNAWKYQHFHLPLPWKTTKNKRLR